MASKLKKWEVTYVRTFYTKIGGNIKKEGSWTDSIVVEATSESVAEKRAESKLKRTYGKGGMSYYNEWEVVLVSIKDIK